MSYVQIINDDDGSGSTFPSPAYGELAYRLIHGSGEVSRRDRLVAASILEAYRYLTLEATNKRRAEVTRKLRAALRPSGGKQS